MPSPNDRKSGGTRVRPVQLKIEESPRMIGADNPACCPGERLALAITLAGASRTTESRIGDFRLHQGPETGPFGSPRVAYRARFGLTPRNRDTIPAREEFKKHCKNNGL